MNPVYAAALAVAMLSIALSLTALWWMVAGYRELHEREAMTAQLERILGNREMDLVRRERALRWAERNPGWLRH